VSKISVANPDDEQEALVDADLDTLATALYVRTDDLLKATPERAPWRPRVGFKPLRQVIESINDTLKAQLDLEQHGGHTPAGVWVRVAQRVLVQTAAIWHNDRTGQLIKRSLLAYDH
jgi:hypothetical protein